MARLDATHEQVLLQFLKDAPVDPRRIVQLVQSNRNWRMTGPDRLKIEAKLPTWQERAKTAQEAFRALAA